MLQTVPARAERLRLVLVLGSLIALGPLTIDMYLPALPTIATELGVAEATVQLTLTGTLVGLGLGQLVIGPLSDALGRRGPLLAGTALHVVASLLCVVAPNVAVLGGLRVLQGLGAAAAAVLTVAIVRDLYDGVAAATLLSRLMLVVGVAPVLAPTLGGGVLAVTGWRGIFVLLAVVGALTLLIEFRAVPETLPPERRRPHGGVRATAGAYRGLLRDRTFVGLVATSGLAMAALFAYVSGSSFVFQQEYGLSEQNFALLFAGGAIGLIGGTQLNARLLQIYPPERILATALAAGLVSGAVLVGLTVADVGGLVGLLVPLWATLAFMGLVIPNGPALAMQRHGEAAGTAAALIGAAQFTVGAIAAPVVGVLGNDSLAMVSVVLGGTALALLVFRLVARPGLVATGPELVHA